MASWTEHSAAWIAEQRKSHPDMTTQELEKLCRASYPFAMRSGWAYKAWLKAMRAYFHPQAVRTKRGGVTQPSLAELEQRGQLRLLD